MLDPRVVEAVAMERFHIWTAETAGEAMELLTGLPFGVLDAEGNYAEDTVLGHAQKTLQDYRRASQATAKPARKSRKAPAGLK